MARSSGVHHSTLTMKSVPDVPPFVTVFRSPLTLFFSLTRGGAKAPTLQTSCHRRLKMGTPFFGLTEGVTPWGREGDFTQAPRGIPYAYESTPFCLGVPGTPPSLTTSARHPGGGFGRKGSTSPPRLRKAFRGHVGRPTGGGSSFNLLVNETTT
jgi:hypothetical protein